MDTPVTPGAERPTDPPPGLLRRVARAVLSPSGLAVILVLVALVLVASMTDLGSEPPHADASDLPREVERIVPANGDLVGPETTVGAQLAAGYTGRLVIDGSSIPDDQLSTPGNGRVFFQPGMQECIAAPGETGSPVTTPGCQPQPKDIERFTAGAHTVTVIFWDATKRESEGSSAYSWMFRVAA